MLHTIKQYINKKIKNILQRILFSFFDYDFISDIIRNYIKKYFNEYYQELYFRMDFYYVGVFGIGASDEDIELMKEHGLERLNDFEWKLMKKDLVELEEYRKIYFQKIYS